MEDPTPPDPPRWVQKSLPEEWPERGIDAHELKAIYLEWYPNSSEDNVEYYKIYKKEIFSSIDTAKSFILAASVEHVDEPYMSFLDVSVSQAAEYEYTIQAVDQVENHSEYSEPSGYSLFPKINIESLTPNGLFDTLSLDRKLRWSFSATRLLVADNYTITILNQDDSLITRKLHTPTTYTGLHEYWTIPDSTNLVPNKNYLWRVDMNGDFVGGVESKGSESLWGTFLFVGE